MPYELWLKRFPPAKRERYASVRVRQLDLVRDKRPVDSKSGVSITEECGTFVKREVQLLCTDLPLQDQLSDPRAIQGAIVELVVEAGPHVAKGLASIKRLGPNRFTKAELRSGKHVIVTSGMTCQQIGNTLAKAIKLVESTMEPDDSIVFLEDDQSRFDLHLGEGAFRCLDGVYKHLYVKRIRHILRRGISRGRTRFGCRYRIPFTMQSGMPDTSTGDSLLNAVMKLRIHGIGRPWVALINGDDSVTVTDRKSVV